MKLLCAIFFFCLAFAFFVAPVYADVITDMFEYADLSGLTVDVQTALGALIVIALIILAGAFIVEVLRSL